MRIFELLVAAAAALALTGAAHADTHDKDKGKAKAKAERKKDKAKPKDKAAEKDTDASRGGSAGEETSVATGGIDLAAAFRKADIDGDGMVSKAEAAGNERLVMGFDRHDRNRDGKLDRQEYDRLYRSKR